MPMHYKFDMPKHLQGGMHSYATGGQVGRGGAPMPPAGAVPAGPPVPPPAGPPVGGPPPGMGVAPAVGGPAAQDDEPLDPAEVQFVLQMLQTAAQNPANYPAIRNEIINLGVMEDDELPPQFSPEWAQPFIQALQEILQSSPNTMPAEGGKPPKALNPATMPNMAMGGAVPSSPQQSKPVPIMAHEGEFVIPPNVVRAKGTDFFQQLIDKYDPAKQAAKGGGSGGGSA